MLYDHHIDHCIVRLHCSGSLLADIWLDCIAGSCPPLLAVANFLCGLVWAAEECRDWRKDCRQDCMVVECREGSYAERCMESLDHLGRR